jgi:hypothetical protein
LEQAFKTLGGIPKVLVSDSEGSLMSKELNQFYKDNDIKHIILKSHAPTAERMIRTAIRKFFVITSFSYVLLPKTPKPLQCMFKI